MKKIVIQNLGGNTLTCYFRKREDYNGICAICDDEITDSHLVRGKWDNPKYSDYIHLVCLVNMASPEERGKLSYDEENLKKLVAFTDFIKGTKEYLISKL